MLQAIDSLFEVYRTLTDEGERRALYHKIDSISYEASLIAIPNEYDKLMSIIGSEGSNAYMRTMPPDRISESRTEPTPSVWNVEMMPPEETLALLTSPHPVTFIAS